MVRLNNDPFSNVKQSNYLKFYDPKNEFHPQKVVEFLSLDRKDVARVSGVSLNSVRYEKERIPEEVKLRLQEIANICEMVAEVFGGSVEKTALWYKLKNPLFGNISPRDLIRLGRFGRVQKTIMNALSGDIE